MITTEDEDMTNEKGLLLPDKGKVLVRKNGKGKQLEGVILGFIKDENGIIKPDSADYYNEVDKTTANENN